MLHSEYLLNRRNLNIAFSARYGYAKSITLLIAGCCRFFTLIQCFDRPT